MADSSGDGEYPVFERTFDTDDENPNVDLTEAVADLKDVSSDELDPLYNCIDHVVDSIYSDPPSPEADVVVSFTYEGYRITLEQDGHATFQELP